MVADNKLPDKWSSTVYGEVKVFGEWGIMGEITSLCL
jgi:hypothetical protein